ncbi:phosphoribosylglycinamide formyltransferase [candidate division LCP-89 bacterium B3_LCP]|uniref:Phosphoribosylglycinamide formyltransferase n=1 Tax=candidate division LCP-89 bacterium B3_LCP TaxID=2012998 RepID=A0A532V285_UNCL8|nr:MAG: phosphoribosylglycinamide formyltransferase [candidate division LCP-89 bacterium B3_LCP]
MVKLAAFASGQGSNFKAIHRHLKKLSLPGRYVLLISDRPNPPVADFANAEGIPFLHLNAKGFSSRDDYVKRLLTELKAHKVEWITLAGYLKLIPSEVVRAYNGRMMNIHPALLPSFGGKGMYGMNVHNAVVDSGVKVSGASVHMVDEEYDTGPVIIQETVPVTYEDTPEEVAARVLEVEHKIYPQAVELAVKDKIRLHGRRVEILP